MTETRQGLDHPTETAAVPERRAADPTGAEAEATGGGHNTNRKENNACSVPLHCRPGGREDYVADNGVEQRYWRSIVSLPSQYIPACLSVNLLIHKSHLLKIREFFP